MFRIRYFIPLVALAMSVGCKADPLVKVSQTSPAILQAIRYATAENFMGRPVRGYQASECMLSHEAAEALNEAQKLAEAEGLSLLVYDCYRPQRAVNHFVEWAADLADTTAKRIYYPDVPKAELFDRGYIASRSGHSRGSTIDLTLARDGVPLDMGTPWDYFDALSHTDNPAISVVAQENRVRLLAIMQAAGFRNYAREWWHYTLNGEPFPDHYFDIPVG